MKPRTPGMQGVVGFWANLILDSRCGIPCPMLASYLTNIGWHWGQWTTGARGTDSTFFERKNSANISRNTRGVWLANIRSRIIELHTCLQRLPYIWTHWPHPGRLKVNFRWVIFKLILVVNDWGIYLLWNCLHMSVIGPYLWQVNIGSGNGLVPSGNKPLPEPMLTQISVDIWHH